MIFINQQYRFKMKSKIKKNNRAYSEDVQQDEFEIGKKKQIGHMLTWASTLSHHIQSYAPISHKNHQDYHFFRIVFLKLDDLQLFLGKRKQYIQFSCIIFDKQNDSYISKTYFSDMFEAENRNTLQSNKSIYFYTELETAVLKVDVWVLESEKSVNKTQIMCKRSYLGNIEIDLSEERETGIIQKPLNKSQINRFFSLQQEDSEQNVSPSKRQKLPGTLTFNIINTHSLSFLHYFVPAEVICDQFNRILGLKNSQIVDNQQIEMDERSCLRIDIKDITVPRAILKPLVDMAEEKIASAYSIIGLANSNIKQLRMHFEFHNGWKSICHQTAVLQEETNQSIIMSKRQIDGKQSNLKNTAKLNDSSASRKFYFEKTKELKPVFTKEGGLLLIWIEAKLESKFDLKDEEGKKQRTEITYIPFAFTLKSIIDLQDESTHQLQLKIGNVYNLEHISKFLADYRTKSKLNLVSSDKLICGFTFSLERNLVGLVTMAETLEKNVNQIQGLRAQKQRLVRMRRKIKQQKRKKLIQLNQQIPFLEATQLKEQLFEQKITKMKIEKQEKEDVLLFLKAKINQLQRQALAHQYKNNHHNDEDAISEDDPYHRDHEVVQKLPDNFIDYKPAETITSYNQGINLNMFSLNYCKKAQLPAKTCTQSMVAQCMQNITYLNIRINKFIAYCHQFATFSIKIENFSGGVEAIGPINTQNSQSDNLSANIRVTFDKKDKVGDILNILKNSFLPIYLQCGGDPKMYGLTLYDCSIFMQNCQKGQILFESQTKQVKFYQQTTLLAKADITISFTQNYHDPNQQQIRKQPQSSNKKKDMNMMERINRFKQNRGDESNKKKHEVINKAVSHLKIHTLNLQCKRFKQQMIEIQINNPENQEKTFTVSIFDEDRQYLDQQQLLFLPNNNIVHLMQGKGKMHLSLNPKQSIKLAFVYFSSRCNKNFSFFNTFSNREILAHNLYKHYNHQHKISISILQKDSNVVEQIYEALVIPQSQFNTIYIQKFIYQKTSVIFPIPCVNLGVKSHDKNVITANTRAVLSVPQLQNLDPFVSQFSLVKQASGGKQSDLIFQNVQFLGWECEKLIIEGRLWEKIDFLIKIPLEIIINRQISQSYLISSITVQSRSVHVKIKQGSQFRYSSHQTVTRKNNEIYIRAQIQLNEIGKNTYGVQVSDQNDSIFYRVGIKCNIPFPSLGSHQTITLKIPKQDLDMPQPFQYTNQQQTAMTFSTRSLKPHLLRCRQQTIDLTIKQKWKIELYFDWQGIIRQMKQQQKDECQLLLGITGGQVIDYFLFKCRLP